MTALATKLTRKITLQSQVQGKDSEGGMVTDWVDFATVWAAPKNFSGEEKNAVKQGGQVAVARTEFMIRYRAGVNSTMRVVFGNAIHNIRHVNDINDEHRILILTCDTGLNDGR
jgi:SPP1 family predicted phage head-tail adaptor